MKECRLFIPIDRPVERIQFLPYNINTANGRQPSRQPLATATSLATGNPRLLTSTGTPPDAPAPAPHRLLHSPAH